MFREALPAAISVGAGSQAAGADKVSRIGLLLDRVSSRICRWCRARFGAVSSFFAGGSGSVRSTSQGFGVGPVLFPTRRPEGDWHIFPRNSAHYRFSDEVTPVRWLR